LTDAVGCAFANGWLAFRKPDNPISATDRALMFSSGPLGLPFATLRISFEQASWNNLYNSDDVMPLAGFGVAPRPWWNCRPQIKC
jgi:hypothetical protein